MRTMDLLPAVSLLLLPATACSGTAELPDQASGARFQSRKMGSSSAVASRSVLHGSTLNTDTESLVKPRTRNSENASRKVAQLCAQVQDIASLALGDSADERLHDLVVHSVSPGPDSARLRVTVVPTEPLDLDSIEQLYRALEGARSGDTSDQDEARTHWSSFQQRGTRTATGRAKRLSR